MTALVTGGAGYIGSHMALALLERGERVVILDNPVNRNEAAHPRRRAVRIWRRRRS